MSGRFPVRIVSVLAVAGLALSACGGGAAPQGQPAQPVTVVTLKAEPVTLTRELPARTNAYLIAEVRPQVSGIVTKRLFVEGGTVKAGQPLYQIDDATYQAENASASAALARAEATLNSARLNAARSAELAKVDAVSQQDHENATAALLQAEADVKLAQASVRSSAIQLDYARITSPISGRIGKSSVTQGALVTANQAEALATVQQLDPVYVDATASSTELLALRRELAAGTLTSAVRTVPVSIVLEDGSTYRHGGKLAFTDVTVDPTTGTFLLRVLVPNPEQLLLPGMYVRAVFSIGVREKGVLVPQQGIARDPKGQTTAMVVGKDGKAEMRPVTVSRTVGDKWLVDEGLSAGDRVIVEGLQKIRPGSPVQATEAQG
jgi:membrane fusion protein (multidrug efflux system)